MTTITITTLEMTTGSESVERPLLTVTNTLGNKRERFVPIDGRRVRLFVCGPTVYDFPHLGHAKTYTQFDFIARALRWLGFDVFYLQNITDIDDKIIQRAADRGISWRKLADEFEQVYYEDMRALHNTAVDKFARATDYIPQIVDQVTRLLESGHAYRTKDGIYYDLTKFPEYGKLSGRRDLRADDAVSRIDDGFEKRNWNDFCLWKAAKSGEPAWETPIGSGRPGWHIEDTAITGAELGEQYDMHGGAIDLIFPHHEAEIAQMEAITARAPLAKYWLHTGFLNIDHEKMSKSKQNFLTIRDALAQYGYRTLRFFFLSQHYKTTVNFSPESLDQARKGLGRIEEFLFNADPSIDDVELSARIDSLRASIAAAVLDDFHTPRVVGAIFEFINAAYAEKVSMGVRVKKLFGELDGLFDCFLPGEVESSDVVDGRPIADLVRLREDLRKRRDYQGADAIRDDLLAHGVQVYDTAEGVRWRRL